MTRPLPFETLNNVWHVPATVGSILAQDARFITVSGTNEIFARGFFEQLITFAKAVRTPVFWLCDLEGSEQYVEFSTSDTQEKYSAKLLAAPEWAPGRPFPLAVCDQAFVGGSDWLLLSDRDGERMHLIMRPEAARAAFKEALSLINEA